MYFWKCWTYNTRLLAADWTNIYIWKYFHIFNCSWMTHSQKVITMDTKSQIQNEVCIALVTGKKLFWLHFETLVLLIDPNEFPEAQRRPRLQPIMPPSASVHSWAPSRLHGTGAASQTPELRRRGLSGQMIWHIHVIPASFVPSRSVTIQCWREASMCTSSLITSQLASYMLADMNNLKNPILKLNI